VRYGHLTTQVVARRLTEAAEPAKKSTDVAKIMAQVRTPEPSSDGDATPREAGEVGEAGERRGSTPDEAEEEAERERALEPSPARGEGRA